MVEVKFTAQKLDGQVITGVLSQDNYWEVKNQIKEIAKIIQQKNITLQCR